MNEMMFDLIGRRYGNVSEMVQMNMVFSVILDRVLSPLELVRLLSMMLTRTCSFKHHV